MRPRRGTFCDDMGPRAQQATRQMVPLVEDSGDR